jgi:6-phosphogluconolactonase
MKPAGFDNLAEMERRALDLLREHFSLSSPGPHAVMLTGGGTPLGIYRRIEKAPPAVDERLHLLVSDERHVPLESPENNFAKMRPMIRAMGIGDWRLMRVHTSLALDAAADRYHEDLASFFDRGGRVTLGILGLGADGHAASLFGPHDVDRGKDRYAIAVPRDAGPDRVSVTRDLLLRVEKLVFLVAGAEKKEAVERLLKRPASIAAGQAVEGHCDVELWRAGGS